MKAAERESPFQVALITQATDLRNLLAAMLAAEMLVLCIAVSASDEDGVVRSADDPQLSKKRSTVRTTTMSPSTAQSSRHASRILIMMLVLFLGCAKKPQQPDVTSLPPGSPTPQSAPTSGR